MAYDSDTTARRIGRMLFVQQAQTAGVNRDDLKALSDYTKTFLESKLAEYVSGMPEPSKSNLSAAQKKVAFALVAMELAGI